MTLAYQISTYNRNRKWNTFINEFEINPDVTVLDVGFAEKEYNKTDNYIEKKYPYPYKLTALGVDIPFQFKKRYPCVNVVIYNGKKFPFRDKKFDIVWSNAVIEHVGSYDKQLFFIKEIKRVSRYAYITTPNKKFPIEVHTRTPFLHYLPKYIFDKYLFLIGKKWATGEYMNLLSLNDINILLSKARINKYKIIKNRFLGFVMDYSIIIKND